MSSLTLILMNRPARWALLVPTLLFCCSALAQHAEPTEPELFKRDQVAEQLRLETLRFNAAAQAVEDDARYPSLTRTAVYLGVELDDLLVSEASVQIDERPDITVKFERSLAIALLRSKGLQRLMLANLDPGPHRVRLTITGQYASASEGDEPVVLQRIVEFDKLPKTTSVVFRAMLTKPVRRDAGSSSIVRLVSQPHLDAQVLREQP